METELIGNILLIALLLLLLATPVLRLTTRTKNPRPPGPRCLPIFGNLHLLNPKNPHRSLLALSLKHGPLMFLQLGSTPTLVVSSAAAAEDIFRHHDLAFSGRPPFAAARKLLYKYTLTFTPYGEHWREARKITVQELFSVRRVRASEAVRFEEVCRLVDVIKGLAAVNLTELTLSLANNVVCRVAVGDRYGGGYDGDFGVRLHEVLSEAQSLLGGFWAADYFPAMGWVDRFVLGRHGRLEKNFGELDGFCEKAIREHVVDEDGGGLATAEKSGGGGGGSGGGGGVGGGGGGKEEREDFLQTLLRLHKVATAGGFLSNMDHVKALIVEAFIAGTDTSSATITWTMTELMRNPRVMQKLKQELQQFSQNIIHEIDLEKLEYLKHVVKESLRLHPPAPLLVPRETIAPCVIHGYTIPAKTRVLINAAAICTDPNAWEEPLEFRPERFEGSPVDFRGQHFEYLPFGAGRRKCPGMNFAVALVELAVANLVHCFDWSMPDGMKVEDINMDEAIGITVHKKEPLLLVAKYKLGA